VTDGATTAIDAVIVAIAILGGYLAGSLPTGRGIGRAAGPGWGFLEGTVDVAKGVLPVAIGLVTWSWWAGWAAALGAVLGACWPALGRRPGGDGVATLVGAGFTLAPAAGAVSLVLALSTMIVGRIAGRDARRLAATVGLATFPALFLVADRDLVRVAGLLVLYLVVLGRSARMGAR
jgi:glycerol-3-phosphate acyltransferase PlsY